MLIVGGRERSKRDKQIWKQEKQRPMARMDHCSLMEVLYYALCGIPGGRRGELTEFPTMIRLMEGHEVFGPLQLRRIDWKQEMFNEEEELEREQGEPEPNTWKASSSGRPMEVDDEGKSTVAGAATVDARKVAEEKEEEEKPSWADVGGDETM